MKKPIFLNLDFFHKSFALLAVLALFFFSYKQGLFEEMKSSWSILDKLGLVALLVNSVILVIAVKQMSLSRMTVEDSTRTRQLELIPKFSWITHVRSDLEKWLNDLEDNKEALKLFLENNDKEILLRIFDNAPKRPSDLFLPKIFYDNMMPWLREIWISGAQYYYNAACCFLFVFEDEKRNGKPNVHFITKGASLDERLLESVSAIRALLNYLEKAVPEDTVPYVIQYTPDSINEEAFMQR